MIIADFEARTERDAVHAACIKLLVEPKGLRYEVIEDPALAKRGRVRIRVFEAHPPEDFGGPRRRAASERGDRPDRPDQGAPLGGTDAMRLGEKLLGGILQRMGVEASVGGIYQDGTVELLVDTADHAVLTTGEEPALPAIQYLLRRVLSHRAEEPVRVVVNIAGLKDERERVMASVGAELANKAVGLGKVVRIHPMSSADRRLVHAALSPDPRVQTVSEGAGPFRRLVIAKR